MTKTLDAHAYLNDTFLPLSQARVSAMDRGFLLSDGVYEFISVFGGKLFRLEQHLERLDRSLQAIQLKIEVSHEKWRDIFETLVEKTQARDQSIYVQITRGPSEHRKLSFPKVIHPTIFAYATPLHPNPIDALAKGGTAITLQDKRWHDCHIKATTLLANVLAHQAAHDKGVDEAILIRDGAAIEGPNSNLFVVHEGTLLTPPKDNYILSGVTRELVLELAEQHNIPFEEKSIPESLLDMAEEIWLTGSSKEILPILQLNGNPVATGQAGTLWHTMIQLYQDYKKKL